MPKLPFLGAVAVALATSLAIGHSAPVQAGDGEDEIVTTISLKDFKAAYGLYSVRNLVDPDPDDGITFKLVKLDDGGQRIIWSDPNHNAVNVRNSYISFTTQTSSGARRTTTPDLDAVMDLFGRTTRGGPLVPASCGVSGSSSSGVTSVTCGDGPSVSPS